MNEYILAPEQIVNYGKYLQNEERSRGTIEKYLRDVKNFANWLDGKPVTMEAVTLWKEHLLAAQYSPATINSMLAALNGFFRFSGWESLRIRFLKIQRRIFREQRRELTRAEYLKLVETACSHRRERLALLIETICSTGIRVSEVQYITVQAARLGRTDISLKGKIRTILLPKKLCRKLLQYAKKNKTVTGEIFITRNGTRLSRKQIWSEMKAICGDAGINSSKVFPHNLRHLFARIFYKSNRDISQLADILGHSSIETTRIYLISTGNEHLKQLERLKLIS